MKKLLVLAAVLCCTFGLFAKIGDPQPELIQLTLGLGTNFYDSNIPGISVGADIDWNVWEKATSHAHDGSGKMYAGLDLAFEYWLPTEKIKPEDVTRHEMRLPIQGNFMYLFDTTQMQGAGPLIAVGPWYSMGVSIDFQAAAGKKDNVKAWNKVHDNVNASFAYGIGAQLSFNNSWGLKAGFGGNAGPFWAHHFMAEAAYRF